MQNGSSSAIVGRPVRSTGAKLRTCARTEYGGAERDRTADPLLAKQVLSQLSYTPETRASPKHPARRPGSDGGSGWTRTIDPRLIKTVL